MITMPTSFSTDISPVTHTRSLAIMVQLGNKIIVELPVSSTVMEKSVPLTPTTAVGVLIFTFCLEFFAICPDAYLTVPKPALSETAPEIGRAHV